MIQDNTVIVIDNSNYASYYAEKTPFKAVIFDKTNSTLWVKSLVTHKDYELYFHQVLEAINIEDIEKLLDMSKYGL